MNVYRCRACGFRAEWPRVEEHCDMEHPGWGGPRPGSGRPPAAAPLKTLSVRLPPEHIEELRRIGDGNASEGVRRLLATALRCAS